MQTWYDVETAHIIWGRTSTDHFGKSPFDKSKQDHKQSNFAQFNISRVRLNRIDMYAGHTSKCISLTYDTFPAPRL